MKCPVCRKFCSEEKLAEHLTLVKMNRFFYCKECCVYYEEKCHPICLYRHQACAFCLQEISDAQQVYHICFHESTAEDFENLKLTNTVLCLFCNRCYHKDKEIEHRRMHDYVRCDVCRILIHSTTLSRHMAKIHLVCSNCGVKFENFNEYEPHYKLHKFEKMSTLCEVCGKRFKASHLTEHVRKHRVLTSQTTVVKCKECGKQFQKVYLKRHMLVHSDDASFTCPICGKGFKNNFNLRVHKRSHDEVKPFECLVCHKTFTTKQCRDNHLTTHKA